MHFAPTTSVARMPAEREYPPDPNWAQTADVEAVAVRAVNEVGGEGGGILAALRRHQAGSASHTARLHAHEQRRLLGGRAGRLPAQCPGGGEDAAGGLQGGNLCRGEARVGTELAGMHPARRAAHAEIAGNPEEVLGLLALGRGAQPELRISGGIMSLPRSTRTTLHALVATHTDAAGEAASGPAREAPSDGMTNASCLPLLMEKTS